MDSEKRTEIIHDLDEQYHRAAHEIDLIIRDEETRRSKVRTLVFRDDASSLKDQLAQRDLRVRELVEQIDAIRAQLDEAHEKSRRQEKLVQSQAREINNLKEELSAINDMAQDSAKILSEKLALAREVALLKPELEHLKSQLAHQKDVLAEKLALERQLNTLEVELANEKRAAQRAAQKHESENGAEEDLRKQLRDMEKELAKERRRADDLAKTQDERSKEMEKELQALREQVKKAETNGSATASGDDEAKEKVARLREKLAKAREALEAEREAKEQLRKENEQAQVDFEERQEAMGDKVEMLRNKLRDTREELKKCKAELEKAQERAAAQSSSATTTTTTTVPLKGPGKAANAKKKRSPDDILREDKILMTPGTADDRPKRPVKKRGFDLSMVGGKSEFSITPFLNKTANNLDALVEEGTPTAAAHPSRATASEEATTTVTSEPPASEAAAPESSSSEPAAAAAAAAAPAPKLVEKRPRGRPRIRPLTDTSASAKNLTKTKSKSAAAAAAAARAEASLDRVAEDPEEEEDSASHEPENRASASTAAAADSSGADPTAETAEAETAETDAVPPLEKPKKKKRKLLGAVNAPATLFDGGEDEGERVLSSAAAAAVAKVSASGVKTAAGAGAKMAGKAGVGAKFGPGVKSAFAGVGGITEPDGNKSSDAYAREAKVQGLKSRAAFKLLELDSKYHLFRRGRGQVVVDLGFAPGSWSQVAADRTAPNGVVVGIDIIPAQPPKGVVLSDMSAPWPQTHGFSVNTLSNPYLRMMNTSGIAFRDHAGSMDLCHAALSFASDTLRPGGHFVCKFYQGREDKELESLLKKMFARVHREKPDSSRSESREAFFVALRRKGDVTLQDIEGHNK
ncbi:hypothetical protein VTJ49DRAFT_271 [Mycothermus thermophilus]|uniref:rRNA methyltransferase 2, mitochondrial n=1 Tax=Humicola insolens TaxID=85995 RepID=A0ABR3VFL3_HUMIN